MATKVLMRKLVLSKCGLGRLSPFLFYLLCSLHFDCCDEAYCSISALSSPYQGHVGSIVWDVALHLCFTAL